MERQGGGAIVNVSSLAGLRHTGHYHAAYEAAKAGMMHFTRTLAVEYGPKNIRANTVVPGHVLTPLVEHRLAKQYRGGDLENLIEERSRDIPMGRMGDAWDVAYAALYLAFGRSQEHHRHRDRRRRRCHRQMRLRGRFERG